MKSLLFLLIFCSNSMMAFAQHDYSGGISFGYIRQNNDFRTDAQSQKILSKCVTNIPGFSDYIACGSAKVENSIILYFSASDFVPKFQITIKNDSYKLKVTYYPALCGRAVTYETKFKIVSLMLNKTIYNVGDTIYGCLNCEFDRIPDINPYNADTGRYFLTMNFTSVLEKGHVRRKNRNLYK